ncbi:MAG: type I DNA topoisomerase [Bdellovibrionota bacterium]
MAKKALIIVESPSKAKTIQKYLGRDYVVKASVGHIKDLPKSKLGVDVEKGFSPDYQLITSKAKVISDLRKASESVPELFLATDPDREGEAIAWHINEELKTRGKKVHRILFNSITKPAIIEAINHPTKLNTAKYHAQQARRVLDRLVGYKISPLLWEKVKRGISAGRVQSVALRMVVERDSEINKFKPEEYWSIDGTFKKDGVEFDASLFKIDGADPVLPNKQTTDELIENIKNVDWRISSIEYKERSRRPYPPFITSRLQQDAARKLGFSAKKTMAVAQRLYEGLDLGDLGTHGLITYMRTDSVRIDPSALSAVREHIAVEYGKEYLPSEPNFYKSKKSAQDAHEAIRPASLEFKPEKIQRYIEKDDFRLYQLIWNRFVASQMNAAIYDQTAVDISSKDRKGREQVFRAAGSVLKFAGFTAVYMVDLEDDDKDQPKSGSALKLPAIKEGDAVVLNSTLPDQHFTQAPPRYTDASLIRDLEEKGIGRPSTYAAILSNLQDREYVEKRENRYYPSELGVVVTDLLVASFPDILNTEFTADMENQLDDIEDGKADWQKTLEKFWKPFEKTLERAKKYMKNIKRQEVPTDINCEKCGQTMVIKWGKQGSFLACSNYPDCKNTQDFKKDEKGDIEIIPKEYTDKKCEKCGNQMVIKNGKYGKFVACSDYPNCKFTLPVTLGIKCPACKEGEMAQRQSRYRRVFYSCSKWPNCTFAMWDKPIEKPCIKCGFPIMAEKITKRAGLFNRCPQKECGHIEVIDPDAGKAEPKSTGTSSKAKEVA